MRRLVPRAVAAVVVAAVLVGTFVLPTAEPVEPIFNRLNALAFAGVGLLACRRPEGRRVGLVCLAVALSAVLFDLSDGYAATGRSGALWAYWAGEWLSLPQSVLLLVVLPAMFPTGHAVGRRWRWVVPSSLALLGVAMLSAALAVDAYEFGTGTYVHYARNPLAATTLDVLLEPAFAVVALGGLVCAIAAWTSLVLRRRRATGTERLQLRWLLVGITALIVMVLALLALGGLSDAGVVDGVLAESVIDGTFGLVTLLLPASIGMAMTRHRLYDLDRVISRTVAYTVVAVVVAGAYLSLVVVLGAVARAATGESGDLVVALSTLAVAALFQPLRRHVGGIVERRFDRARYDAARTIDAFGRSLRDEVSLEAIGTQLRIVTGTTFRPVAVGLAMTPAGSMQGADDDR